MPTAVGLQSRGSDEFLEVAAAALSYLAILADLAIEADTVVPHEPHILHGKIGTLTRNAFDQCDIQRSFIV